MDTTVTLPLVKQPKEPTPSQRFKLTYGYSLTSLAMMKKYKCATFEEYKRLRNKRKKERMNLTAKPLVEKPKVAKDKKK
jgi:hypothetical protein